MYYSYEQYREAQDDMFSEYCGRNEFQNAYELSRIEEAMIPDDSQKILNALAEGKFVVFRQCEIYCQFTDALIGLRDYLVSTHDTLVEAESVVAKNKDNDLCLQKPYSPWKPPVKPVDDSDVPF